jgi:hypothetical protein
VPHVFGENSWRKLVARWTRRSRDARFDLPIRLEPWTRAVEPTCPCAKSEALEKLRDFLGTTMPLWA